MNTTSVPRWLVAFAFFLTLAGVGCEGDAPSGSSTPAKGTAKAVEATRKKIGKNVYFETQGEQRRVIIEATVCLREGNLEGLLCRKGSKEHEYILAADVDARHIHAALIAAKAKPGSPVKFEPKYEAAHGTPIKITLQYEQKSQLITVSARQWLQGKDKKNLDIDWVFGGSQFVADPTNKDKPPVYLANYGDVICVCNMDSAMLDLPIKSAKRPEDRLWFAYTERIPPVDTKVTVILEPVPEKSGE